MAGLTVADVMSALDRRYPPGLAEDWDRNGLYCGDSSRPVSKVLFAVDPTDQVITEAVAGGAEMLVTHHPLLLRGVHSVAESTPKGRRLSSMIRAGISAFNVHTPADCAPDGVSDAVAELLGLTELAPLSPRDQTDTDKIITFVPEEHAPRIVDALAAAGAGVIGNYERCVFSVEGVGSFRPGDATDPFIGHPGVVECVTEQRIEMVLPRRRRDAVVAALRAAHPYEEVAYDLVPLASALTPTGIGRIGLLPTPVTARALAAALAEHLPPTVGGIKLGGDPDRLVARVAVLAGSGDSHLDVARRAGAEAYVTSDLRHHPADEALAWDDAPVLIDVPHWACEWAWLPHGAAALRSDLGPELDVSVSTLRTEPWSMTVGRISQ